MPSDLRKRNLSDLPRTLKNPLPPSPDSPTHASLRRHKPTIAPTVFIGLIFGLTALLFPIFYYTQVMIPHPESTSILSHFKREGHKLLAGLGHVTQNGPGRPEFVLDLKAQAQADKSLNTGSDIPRSNNPDSVPFDSAIKSKPIDQIRSLLSNVKFKLGLQKAKEEKEGSQSVTSEKSMTEKERDELDDQLGQFWQASSRYRSEAQSKAAGEYAITGDGTSTSENEPRASAIEKLPEADPDAKEGLTPEVWKAISEELTADEMTVMLNAIRSKEP